MLIRSVLEPVGRMIFKQDADMLKQQTETIERFGGEQFVSTDIDVLGPEIWRLMRAGEREKLRPSEDGPTEKHLKMNV